MSSIYETLLVLSEASMLLKGDVEVTQENDAGDEKVTTIPACEYVIFSMAVTMIDKGYNKDEVVAALEKIGVLLPDDEYMYVSVVHRV